MYITRTHIHTQREKGRENETHTHTHTRARAHTHTRTHAHTHTPRVRCEGGTGATLRMQLPVAIVVFTAERLFVFQLRSRVCLLPHCTHRGTRCPPRQRQHHGPRRNGGSTPSRHWRHPRSSTSGRSVVRRSQCPRGCGNALRKAYTVRLSHSTVLWLRAKSRSSDNANALDAADATDLVRLNNNRSATGTVCVQSAA